MEIKVTQTDITRSDADAILLNLFEGTSPEGACAAVDRALNGGIAELIRSNDLRGKLNEVVVLYRAAPSPPRA